MTRPVIVSVPLLSLLVLALVGCGPTPPPIDTPADPRPTPPATATPIPVPTPTETLPPETLDPLETVTHILLLTEIVQFCDDVACGVDGFRYDDSPDFAIAKLTAVFGIGPTVESYEGYAGSTSYDYRWGEGFLLYFSTGGSAEVDHLVRVQVTTPSVVDVTIETVGGVHVGSLWADAAAAADSVREASGETDDGVLEARFDATPTGSPNEFDAILGFGNVGGTGPVTTLVGPITIGELPGY
jgi:hypothetical protein